MAGATKILAFAGSLRKGSYNKMMVKVAMEGARKAGAQVTFIDLADYPLPIFDEDLEAKDGLHANAAKLKALFKEHDGFLIASPEYNSSLSAALKNTIDWVSRPTGDARPLEAFAGKVVGIMAASPGGLGGLRGMVHLRAILGNIQVLVIPEQHALVKAHEVFDASGQLKDAAQTETVQKIGAKVVQVVSKLRS